MPAPSGFKVYTTLDEIESGEVIANGPSRVATNLDVTEGLR